MSYTVFAVKKDGTTLCIGPSSRDEISGTFPADEFDSFGAALHRIANYPEVQAIYAIELSDDPLSDDPWNLNTIFRLGANTRLQDCDCGKGRTFTPHWVRYRKDGY
jgi:hypothetical protein